MNAVLSGKGIFVFSDPGGAKPILALVKSLQGQLDGFMIISDREYGFFKDFSLDVHKPNVGYTEVEAFDPDFIFTGTSYTSSIELSYIKVGLQKSIPTYAFVDHWTNIRERFNNNGEEILPDKICLVDEKAKEIGLQQGLDESSIMVIGNPFQDYLKLWKPSLSKHEFFETIGLRLNGRKVIVFAPDPLSNVNGLEKFGFDELIVLRELDEIIDEILAKFILVFKPHPNQSINRLDSQILNKMVLVNQEVDNNSLIYYSDVIMGFFSSYLIESQIMNKKVLRYLPNTAINDPFYENRIGIIVNRENLLSILNQLFL